MFSNRANLGLAGSASIKSVLTGEFISNVSEEFRHEREVEFLCSLSPDCLEDILTGFGRRGSHRSITAIRGPAEVRFLRSQISLFRLRTDAVPALAR
ncbi:hypothetical protein [Bosea sp. 685]|uniref:DUF7696 family protein n=1 Tax=Bosea sp. 685 TaxID=3080057 RepID=UPI002892A708|nr:hypothetical protein [Bosea sp. 685]WNJ88450.1 hypothetical protein RMR04_18770 [Bosea sp. 685]